jgi:hypothetical protein
MAGMLAIVAEAGGRNAAQSSRRERYPARAVTIHALALKTTRPF